FGSSGRLPPRRNLVHAPCRLRAPCAGFASGRIAPLGRLAGVAATRGSHLDRPPLLHHARRNLLQKTRADGSHELAVPASALGVRQIELSLGACDPDVKETPLLLELWRIVKRLRGWKQSVLETGDEDNGE